MQRPGARRGDADMRREPAIRVDLVRWKRQHGPVRGRGGKTLKRRQKEADVADRLLEVAVAGTTYRTTP